MDCLKNHNYFNYLEFKNENIHLIMATKKITIKTSKDKFMFEVDEYNSKYSLYKISYGGWLGGKKIRDKIGETKSLEDAVTIAKTSINGSIRNIEIT